MSDLVPDPPEDLTCFSKPDLYKDWYHVVIRERQRWNALMWLMDDGCVYSVDYVNFYNPLGHKAEFFFRDSQVAVLFKLTFG